MEETSFRGMVSPICFAPHDAMAPSTGGRLESILSSAAPSAQTIGVSASKYVMYALFVRRLIDRSMQQSLSKEQFVDSLPRECRGVRARQASEVAQCIPTCHHRLRHQLWRISRRD